MYSEPLTSAAHQQVVRYRAVIAPNATQVGYEWNEQIFQFVLENVACKRRIKPTGS